MATQVDEALVEVRAELVSVAPQLEGLRDFARLNLKEETQREVALAIEDFERRVSRLTAAEFSLAGLVEDGHPELPVREVVAAVFADLQDQVNTIGAAFQLFDPPELAAELGLAARPPIPKV